MEKILPERLRRFAEHLAAFATELRRWRRLGCCVSSSESLLSDSEEEEEEEEEEEDEDRLLLRVVSYLDSLERSKRLFFKLATMAALDLRRRLLMELEVEWA